MTRRIRNLLAAAAVLAAGTFALPAHAHDAWSDHGSLPPAGAYPGAPGVVPAPLVSAPRPAAVSVPYRPARWREWPAGRELRAEYRRLELARDRFYATWDGRPWSRHRFEAWYASRRAELDHRWAELSRPDHRW